MTFCYDLSRPSNEPTRLVHLIAFFMLSRDTLCYHCVSYSLFSVSQVIETFRYLVCF